MSRLVDRGAITAAYVGIGMAVTIVVSFMLFIPIEWIIWILALPSGLLIGYYANQRSDRRAGPWGRILVNGLFAGFITGLTAAVLLLAIKGLFFYADNGFRDPGLGGPISCSVGADCVYQRYLDDGRGPVLEAAGVTDAESFARFYWGEQFGSAGTILVLTTLGGLGGAALYGVFRPNVAAVPTVAVPSAGRPPVALPAPASPSVDAGAIDVAARSILDLVLPFAKQMIVDQGGVLPFAVTVDADGRTAWVGSVSGATDGEPQSPAEMMALLEGGLRAQVAAGSIVATGLCYEATFRADEGSDPTDVIVIEMEHKGEEPVEVVQPFARRAEDNEVSFADPVGRPGRDRIFFAQAST